MRSVIFMDNWRVSTKRLRLLRQIVLLQLKLSSWVDYTDRDKDSRGVIDRLIEGRDVGRDWIFLKGNHDWMSE
jgi:hypothetical protein